MSDPIPLAKPLLGEREIELIEEVVGSGVLSLGPKLEQFERDFAEYLGVEHAVAVSSGTAALHLCIRALGIGTGDEVITTPLSFVASANCLIYERAKPVFVDIDPVTLNIDPTKIEAAITERTKAILPVHIFGYPAALEEIEAVAERHGLGLIEDACEALGAVHSDGVPVGARGNLSCFAFYPNKQITTGEGGMVVTSDRQLEELITSERNQGRAPDMSEVEHVRLGYNYRLNELACALGIAQLEKLEEILARRSQVASWYEQRLSGVEGLTLPCPDSEGPQRSWFVYVVQLDGGTDRKAVVEELADQGIAAKAYLPAIHLQPYYRESFGYKKGDLPVCEDVAERSLALPFYTELSESQVGRVCEALVKVLA